MKQSTNLNKIEATVNQYEEIDRKILQSEEDYKNGRVRKAEDVFKEWKLKYEI